MEKLIRVEQALLMGHILSMGFGLAGILLVLPNPDLIATLPEIGRTALPLSMANGGVVYMLLGTAAVAIYAYRTLGVWHCLGFMLPAIGLSLGSELLGTSTGFPFGHYRYLSGLGYKIAGLVPFTIPLSWFYLGFSAYIIALAGLETLNITMSQASLPFWVWEQPGAFFGMPYENFAGWFGTGVVFMSVASFIWQARSFSIPRTDLRLPFAIYLSNFAFAMVMSLAAGIYIPVILGLILGIVPLLVFYQMATAEPVELTPESLEPEIN
jgi:uncharacterized membrane protein